MNDPVVDALSAFFRPRLTAGDRVCVALSGGRDSVVLLHALARLRKSMILPFPLSALHVHHGLSPKAGAWAEFCRDFCEGLGVPMTVSRVDVPRDSGEGIEGAARRARYAAFAASKTDWLVLGHHQDDQAETVFLNLLRGAGVAGLAGMPVERFARLASSGTRSPVFARPLLDLPRAVIESYADRENLSWIDDESNEDTRFRRNFLRRVIVPRLETSFPGTRKSLARAAKHFAESAALLDELAGMDREKLLSASGRVSVAGLKRLSPPRVKNLLRFLWKSAGFSAPDARWIDEAIRQLATASAETCVSTADGELRVYRDELYVLPVLPHHANPLDTPAECFLKSGEAGEGISWAGGVIRLVSTRGAGIRRNSIEEGNAVFQTLQEGERLKIHPARPRKSLGKLFQEAGIPPWERKRLPCLRIRGKLAWIGGVGVAVEFSCAAGEEGIMPFWAP
ncbi:MAG: tRNA lysidine(34) synthetase TilS [Candidatus Accumulibacter sp.]|jgi:tRNA(Ile)-lysidine synthase|nr:tRNA lysidine(34) synthetase TilS [Accumulibacter sp.]